MSGYEFELATESDEEALRNLVGSIATPGEIELIFKREPNFFRSISCEGDLNQVAVARSRVNRQIVGCGIRSIQSRFVDGKPMPVGYLSSLRLANGHRGRGLVQRGYRFMQQLHEDGQTPFYLTTVAKGNYVAEKLLTSKAKYLPKYLPFGSFFTLVIQVRRFGFKPSRFGFEIRTATINDAELIVSFLNKEGSKRLFANHYGNTSIFHGDKLSGLELQDVLLAFRGTELVGILGGWDQNSFRQAIVHRYNGRLDRWRWLFNITQGLKGAKSLPKLGEPFRYLLGAFCLIKNWDSNIFRALLECHLIQSNQGPFHYFLVGLHETDPLLATARQYSSVEYETKLYVVTWDDLDNYIHSDSLPIQLELGGL